MDNFLKLTNDLNEYAKNNQEVYDYMQEEDIIKAIYYLDNIAINNEMDVLIFLLAMNLCNAYAKKVDNHIIYKFKKEIGTIINVLNNKKINNVKICNIIDKGSLYIFKIGNIQFSFHDQKKIDIDEYYHEDMIWDGIKKQPCALSLFNMGINDELNNNTITRFGDNIKIMLSKLLDDYHNNKITSSDIIKDL